MNVVKNDDILCYSDKIRLNVTKQYNIYNLWLIAFSTCITLKLLK